jgi:hypothetical protein
MSCTRASKFLDAHDLDPAERVSASRKLAKSDAARLAGAAKRVIVAKGKSVQTFSPRGKATPEVVAQLLGPTGNLRAPALVAGDLLLVGWSEEAWAAALL